ncbi:translation initiation factor IF-2-like [Gymnogyps californianus]|uniref:translation initiation factor IF-2-like n=1 Tax=Gymnogyps californianus TaxID=33616 RepID=UPI0021C8835E|nr:translation initiation factor IF-2-like [Gymnogyps californianus]
MWRSEQAPAGSGSPGCPDLLRHVGGPRLPLSPLYLSFFEEECRAIATRLRLGAAAAAEPSPGPGEGSALWPDAAGPVTSTPLRASQPLDEGAPDSATPAACPSTGGCEAAAAPGPARGEPRRLPQPAAGGCPGTARPGSRLARPQALSRKAARRGAGQPPCGGPGPAGRPPARSPGRGGGGRLSLSRVRASLGLELPKASKGLGAPGTRLPQPPGTKLKLMLAAKSMLHHPSRALQLAKWVPKPAPRDTETESKADQTWVCGGSSFSSELAPDLTPGCGDAVPAEQSAGDQLSQELKRVKNELERVKGELADKTAQCEAYHQMISSLQAQLRAAGICPEDAAVEESGDSGGD